MIEDIKEAVACMKEVQGVYKKPMVKNRVKISNSAEAVQIVRALYDITGINLDLYECMFAIYFDRDTRFIGFKKISEGGVAGTAADPKKIFQFGLLLHASSLVIAHNHPSGNTEPSDADYTMSKKIKQAGEVLDMPLLNSIILTTDSYYSFADEATF